MINDRPLDYPDGWLTEGGWGRVGVGVGVAWRGEFCGCGLAPEC
jgi:hypothetical protein